MKKYRPEYSCPKCKSINHQIKYSHINNIIAVTCDTCGFWESLLPCDGSKDSDPTIELKEFWLGVRHDFPLTYRVDLESCDILSLPPQNSEKYIKILKVRVCDDL